MKQEFASARYMAFAGTHSRAVHFSDRRVSLANTLDYPAYSYATEQIKTSFRIAYSLFDKIAFFLNTYLALNIPDKLVSFRTLWYDDYKRKRLRPAVVSLPYSALKALFWLAKDFYEEASGLPASLEPEARQLAATRNHLEHKYLKVHLPEWRGVAPLDDLTVQSLADRLAFSVRRDDFVDKTVRLLQLVRSALLYLACTVHQQETLSTKIRKARSVPIVLDEWRDDWKY